MHSWAGERVARRRPRSIRLSTGDGTRSGRRGWIPYSTISRSQTSKGRRATRWRPGPIARRGGKGAEAVLVFHHGRGGGSSYFLDLYERSLENAGHNVLRARTILDAPALAVVGDRTFDLASRLETLVQFARQRGVTRLVVNHLIDRPVQMMMWMRELGARLGVPYDVILHDYFMLCPRIDLVTGHGAFCDVAPSEVCVQCVTTYGAEVGDFDPLSWRDDHLAFLAGANRRRCTERRSCGADAALSAPADHRLGARARCGLSPRAHAESLRRPSTCASSPWGH